MNEEQDQLGYARAVVEEVARRGGIVDEEREDRLDDARSVVEDAARLDLTRLPRREMVQWFARLFYAAGDAVEVAECWRRQPPAA